MPSIPRYYWDSNVFLSYIEGTTGRMNDIEALLEDAEAGRCEIYTSVLTVAEVAFAEAEKVGRQLDPAVEAAIDALLHSGCVADGRFPSFQASTTSGRSVVRSDHFS